MNTWNTLRYDQKIHGTIVHQHESILATDIVVKNGTWPKFTTRSEHSLIIPELELQIPHWCEFTQNRAYKLFVEVYSTTNMTAEEIQEQANATWTGQNEPSVMMRTACFGRGQYDVPNVCIRDLDENETSEAVNNGTGDDMLVQLGLFALYRIRFDEENLRGFSEEHDIYNLTNANQTVLI